MVFYGKRKLEIEFAIERDNLEEAREFIENNTIEKIANSAELIDLPIIKYSNRIESSDGEFGTILFEETNSYKKGE